MYSAAAAHCDMRDRGRPSEPLQPQPDLPEYLEHCGHDYMKTTTDKTIYPAEIVQAMHENMVLQQRVASLESRSLCLANIRDNDKLFQFYTNLPNYAVFDALSDYLLKRAVQTDGLSRWNGPKRYSKQMKSGVHSTRLSSRKLSFEDELFLVLLKLKTGRMNEDLAFHFDISVGSVSHIFSTWLCFLFNELKLLFEMANVGCEVDGIPAIYRSLFGLRIVIDCTELMLQKPSDLQERKETFSNYKHHDTVKFLVGMSPALCINYVSSAWAGRASDKHITLNSSSMLDKLSPGATVMADRGFTVSQELKKLGVETIIPDFKGSGRSQMTASECKNSEDIAKARIHIERIIQRIRTFHVLGSVVRLNMTDVVEQLFTVCAYLTNFQTPIIASGELKCCQH